MTNFAAENKTTRSVMNKRKTKIMLCLMAGLCLAGPAQAQDSDRVGLTPDLDGPIRGKYE